MLPLYMYLGKLPNSLKYPWDDKELVQCSTTLRFHCYCPSAYRCPLAGQWQEGVAVWCSFRCIDSNNIQDQFPNPKAHGKIFLILIVQGNPQHTETELGSITDCSRVQPLSRRLVPEHKPCVEVSQTISSQRGGIPYSRSQFLHPGIGTPDSCSFHIAQTPMTYGGPIGRLCTAEHG